MQDVKYCEGTGLLVVQNNRLLFLSSIDFPSALNIEVAAFLGDDPIRSLAIALANEDSEVSPFVFVQLAEQLQCIVYGDMRLLIDDEESTVLDGAIDDFWAYSNNASTATISCGDSEGNLWLSTGAVRASSFRWSPNEQPETPLVLVAKLASQMDPELNKPVDALVCFECNSPNPPMTPRCRACNAFLTEYNSDIQAVSQPVLGVIYLSGGRTELLDADLIIGRNPHRYEIQSHQRGVVDGIGDQSVSRRHLELRREGWQLMVVSLQQGSEPIIQSQLGGRTSLQFGVPCQLHDGDTVHYGNGWLRYDKDAPVIFHHQQLNG